MAGATKTLSHANVALTAFCLVTPPILLVLYLMLHHSVAHLEQKEAVKASSVAILQKKETDVAAKVAVAQTALADVCAKLKSVEGDVGNLSSSQREGISRTSPMFFNDVSALDGSIANLNQQAVCGAA